MRIINKTNIKHAKRIIRFFASGIDTPDLEVTLAFPDIDTNSDDKTKGTFLPTRPPKIRIYPHKEFPLTYRLYNGNRISIENIHVYIAFVFLHELYHYAIHQKGLPYAKQKEEELADTYACKTLQKLGIKI